MGFTAASARGTPPAIAPPPGHPRFPLVDSLRAIAALGIVAFHAGAFTFTSWDGFLSHADVGVAVFFAISGFLLYRPFVSARLNAARPTRLRDYFRRRLLRIVPAYWLALTVLAIWPGLPDVFTGHFWVYYGFLQIYRLQWLFNGISQAWTLCVELTFYLALPAYAALLSRSLGRLPRQRQVRLELGVIGLIALSSLAYRGYLRSELSLSPALTSLPTLLGWFAPGMALAVLSAACQDRTPPRAIAYLAARPWLSVGGAVGAYVTVSVVVGQPTATVHYFAGVGHVPTAGGDVAQFVLYAVAGAGLLFPAVFGHGGVTRRVLGWRVLAWLGLVSYGIYLWQSVLRWLCQGNGLRGCQFHGATLLRRAPFISLSVITALAATACAALSYYLVERPILRLKYLRPRSPGTAPARRSADRS